MQSSISRRSLLNYAGIAVLLAGLAAGELIYWRSLHRAAAGDDPLALAESKKDFERQVEVNVGTFGMITGQLDRALASLGEPGPLAVTICVVSLAAAGLCFMAASRMPRA